MTIAHAHLETVDELVLFVFTITAINVDHVVFASKSIRHVFIV